MGTGFFISPEGHVLTNRNKATHLDNGQKADRISVDHNGIDYAAEILGSDRSTNLTLIKVDTLPKNFNFVHLSDSPVTPPIGSMVVRLSALHEFGPSPRLGLVTGLESSFGTESFRVPYIRTNMPLGPGESGSPLLDLSGKLVAVSVANLPPNLQSSYSIPARAALRIRDELLFSGLVTYGWLGFQVQMRTTTQQGAQVVLQQIMPDGPAEKSGLLTGDILLKIGDQDIRHTGDVGQALFYLREGQFVTARVIRGTEQIDFTVKVEAWPEDQPFLAKTGTLSGEKDNETPFKEGVQQPVAAEVANVESENISNGDAVANTVEVEGGESKNSGNDDQ